MSTVTEIEEAAGRLPPEEFAQLLEDLQDLALARAALARIESGEEKTIPWSKLRDELDAAHG
jgi:predicted DNA-binding protein